MGVGLNSLNQSANKTGTKEINEKYRNPVYVYVGFVSMMIKTILSMDVSTNQSRFFIFEMTFK